MNYVINICYYVSMKEKSQNDIPLLNKGFHDVNPVVCGWQDCDSGHSFGPAIRDYYLIHYVTDGKGIFERQGTVYTVSKDHMFLIRPHELTYYQADYEHPWSYIWIGFNGVFAEELLDGSGFDKSPVIYSPSCAFIFRNMISAGKSGKSAEIYLCGLIYELFARLKEENNAGARAAQTYVLRAENYIRSNYMYDISVEGISKMLGIDRRYLYRIFTEYTGTSPQKYILKYRLRKAAELLSKYDCSVGEAARSCGYKDMFNFSNMFKKEYGISPSEYKRKFFRASG